MKGIYLLSIAMDNNRENIGFYYGLIGGVSLIVLFLGLYFYNPDMLFRRMGIFSFFILLSIMLWTGRIARNKIGGKTLTFRELVKPIFTVWVVSMAIIVFFFYTFYNFLDTGMSEALQDWYVADITYQMELAGKSEQFMEKELNTLKNSDYSYGVFRALQTYVLSLVFGFLMAAAIAVGFLYARLVKEQK